MCHQTYSGWHIHFTVQRHPRPDVLRLLLQRQPESCKTQDDEDYLLLHRAILSEGVLRVEAIQLVLDANPDAIFETCEKWGNSVTFCL